MAGLMHDLLHTLEDWRRQGGFSEEMKGWDAVTRAHWQERYRRLRVQLRPLGVALGIESHRRPPHVSRSHPAPGHPAEPLGMQALFEPVEATTFDPAALPVEPDAETAEVLARDVDADDDPRDRSMAADGVLEIPSEERLDSFQEVER